jgi:hypothetical protein
MKTALHRDQITNQDDALLAAFGLVKQAIRDAVGMVNNLPLSELRSFIFAIQLDAILPAYSATESLTDDAMEKS